MKSMCETLKQINADFAIDSRESIAITMAAYALIYILINNEGPAFTSFVKEAEEPLSEFEKSEITKFIKE